MHTLLLRGVGSGAGGAWAGRSAALANWRDESNVSTDAVYAPDAAHDPLAVEVALRDIDECGDYVFDSVKSFVMFAGYPRSGHTLIATMLDAHPQIVMADEYHVLHPEHAHLLEGDDPLRLYSEVSQWSTYVWSKGLASKDSIKYYNYSIPGLWQGKYSCIQVIGDKKGSSVPLELLRDEEGTLRKLKWLEQVAGCGSLKMIHVVRNPYDNIATMAWKKLGYDGTHRNNTQVTRRPWVDVEREVRKKALYYMQCHDAIEGYLKTRPAAKVLTIHDPDVAADTETEVRRWCRFLGVACSSDFVRRLSSKVYPHTYRSRDHFEWDATFLGEFKTWLDNKPILKRYSFDSE